MITNHFNVSAHELLACYARSNKMGLTHIVICVDVPVLGEPCSYPSQGVLVQSCRMFVAGNLRKWEIKVLKLTFSNALLEESFGTRRKFWTQ